MAPTPADLPARWRKRAAILKAHGAMQAALTLRRCAADLESSLTVAAAEALTLAQAAEESGYSADRLRHLLAEGALHNAGERGKPRIRRADLPRKKKRADGFDPKAAAARLLRGA